LFSAEGGIEAGFPARMVPGRVGQKLGWLSDTDGKFGTADWISGTLTGITVNTKKWNFR
jgi:hypothetical protein